MHFKLSLLVSALFFSVVILRNVAIVMLKYEANVMLRNEESLSAMPVMLSYSE